MRRKKTTNVRRVSFTEITKKTPLLIKSDEEPSLEMSNSVCIVSEAIFPCMFAELKKATGMRVLPVRKICKMGSRRGRFHVNTLPKH